MTGAIIINGYYQSDAYSHQVSRLLKEFSQRGVSLEVIKNNKGFDVNLDLGVDFVIFLDKDKYLARILAQKGVIIFNNPFAIEHCDDKILTTISLMKSNKIVSPRTIIAPIKYQQNAEIEFIESVEEQLQYPFVAKKAISSLGDGIKLIENRKQFIDTEIQWSLVSHLYQEYVAQSKGKSYRAFVIGHKVVACMLLENTSDFRSNAKGSKAFNITLDNSYINMAQQASRHLELDFCAVDFCVGDSPLLLEINSNAFFEKIENVSGVNIGGLIAEYVIRFLGEIG